MTDGTAPAHVWTNEDEWKQRTADMQAALADASLRDVLAYRSKFTGFDNLLMRLTQNADGTRANTAQEAAGLAAWADCLRQYALIVQDKAA